MSKATEKQDAFSDYVDAVQSRCNELMALVPTGVGRASLCNFVFEQSLLNVCVAWEHFVHDIFVAHVVDNPSRLFSSYDDRLKNSVRAKFGPRIADKVTLKHWKKLGFTHAEEILDPKGFNLVFRGASELAVKASELFQPSLAIKFALGHEDIEIIDAVVSLRNYLSHASTNSSRSMRDTISAISATGVNAPLNGQVRSAGVYLRANVPGGTRLTFIIERLKAISVGFV